MKSTNYLPNVVAAFRSCSRILRIYQDNICILNEFVGNDAERDADYWDTIYLGDKVLDINLHEEMGYAEPTLTAYPIVNNEIDCSVWQYIKLKVLLI